MGIKVNVTSQEASSAPRELLPVGKYLVSVTDGQLKAATSDKNKGKPFYALELTVNDHPDHDGRKLWANVMCFEGALYSMVQMLKALGVEFIGESFQVPSHEEGEIPELDWFIGQQFVVSVVQTKETTGKDGKVYAPRNDIKSWMSAKTWTGAPAAGTKSKTSGNSLLPA